MTRATGEHNLDSKGLERSDASIKAVLSITNEEMQHHQQLGRPNQANHSKTETLSFVDFGRAHDLYGGSSDDIFGSSRANDSAKGAHKSVQLADHQDLGKAFQEAQQWVGGVIDAGKHYIESLGKDTAPPKAAPPEQPQPEEKFVPFNPTIHGTKGIHWKNADEFTKYINAHDNDEALIFYDPKDDAPTDCDPGFTLPMDKKGAPEIDRGFLIPSGRTTRQVIKNDNLGAALDGPNRDEDLKAVLAGIH
ncbi:MAG: hypothetical protein JST89_13030 [Cyanobacteria bacterium SZAS-4]|nr:hypothetical protein [Cyanobacteria bacterium SZAS-4]